MERFIGRKLELLEMPNLRYGNPNVKVGTRYEVVDIEGSNFWIIDDGGEKVSFGSSRFCLN